MASPRKKWYKRKLAEQEAKEAEAQPGAVVHPIDDVVIAPNSEASTKPKNARPIKSSRRRPKKDKKE